MLEYLRNAAEKPVAKILIGILAFSFIGWGVAEWIFGGVVGDNTLVRVGGQEVSVGQYTQMRSQELAKLSREQQRAIYADPVAMAEFSNKIMARMTTEKMTAARANDLGYVVTDKRIADEIRTMPEFQTNGQFSSNTFDWALASAGLSEADFAAALRAQIMREMVLSVLNVPVAVPEFVVTATYNARYGLRQIEVANVKYSDFTAGEPTDDQLRDFYAQNPQMIEETRSVSYVLIPAEMDKPDAYEAALSTAQQVEDDIIGGDALSAAAARHGAKYQMHDAFAAGARPVDTVLTDAVVSKIFTMDEGVESELIETKQGFLIVRVEKINPRHKAEFDTIKTSLTGDWRRAEQRKQAYLRANEILSAAKQNGAIAGAHQQTVSRVDGAPLKVLASAFATPVGDTTIVDGDDSFYVLRVAGETLPSADNAKKDALRKELQNTMQRNLTDDYNSFLMREYPVKVNKRVYEKVFAK